MRWSGRTWAELGRPVRCIEGRLYRHDPQHDDPNLETDIGTCPDCDGYGCDEIDRSGPIMVVAIGSTDWARRDIDLPPRQNTPVVTVSGPPAPPPPVRHLHTPADDLARHLASVKRARKAAKLKRDWR